MKKRFLTPFLFAILLHVVVFIFIFFSISFSSQPTSMPSAAPEQINIVKAVTVNQAQVDQEIAHLQQQQAAAKAAQQAREQQAAQQRLEAKRETERAAKALAAVKAEKALLAQQKQQAAQQQQKLAQQKAQQDQENLKRQKQQAAQQELQQKLQAEQQELAAANAKRVAGLVNKYNALILNAIYPNWIVNDKQKNLSTDLLINLASDGSVLNVTVAQSSGSANFDRSAVAAVYKSSPLPVPQDPQAFAEFKQFRLTLKPDNIVSQ
ncbi:MAG: cell envelope integrity protein TolA [Gammaproteobacteria bacterium]|nr:cell envelope integrity protein TolA [Gammaproteobacteria bacterium]